MQHATHGAGKLPAGFLGLSDKEARLGAHLRDYLSVFHQLYPHRCGQHGWSILRRGSLAARGRGVELGHEAADQQPPASIEPPDVLCILHHPCRTPAKAPRTTPLAHLTPNPASPRLARRPLYLTPPNECGVPKFVCTTLRPSLLPYPELYSLDGRGKGGRRGTKDEQVAPECVSQPHTRRRRHMLCDHAPPSSPSSHTPPRLPPGLISPPPDHARRRGALCRRVRDV